MLSGTGPQGAGAEVNIVRRVLRSPRHPDGVGPDSRDRHRDLRCSNTTKIHQSAAAAAQGNTSSAVNVNCDIIVPAHPLSARGLATPYQLTGPSGTTPQASGCEMTNTVNLGAFVQATILDRAPARCRSITPGYHGRDQARRRA